MRGDAEDFAIPPHGAPHRIAEVEFIPPAGRRLKHRQRGKNRKPSIVGEGNHKFRRQALAEPSFHDTFRQRGKRENSDRYWLGLPAGPGGDGRRAIADCLFISVSIGKLLYGSDEPKPLARDRLD